MACMKRKNITPYGTIHVLVPVTKCNLHFLSVMLFNSDDRFIYKCILIFFFPLEEMWYFMQYWYLWMRLMAYMTRLHLPSDILMKMLLKKNSFC